jgi:hypothetical protein
LNINSLKDIREVQRYCKPYSTEFDTLQIFFKSTETRGEKTDEKFYWTKPDSPIFLERTESKTKWVEPSSFNRYFSPFVINHQKDVGEVFYMIHSALSSSSSSSWVWAGGGDSNGGGWEEEAPAMLP